MKSLTIAFPQTAVRSEVRVPRVAETPAPSATVQNRKPGFSLLRFFWGEIEKAAPAVHPGMGMPC